jgi:hypothetical protein
MTTYRAALIPTIPTMADGELIVFNNSTFWGTPAREAAVAEIQARGLSRNGFYTDDAIRLADEWVRAEAFSEA